MSIPLVCIIEASYSQSKRKLVSVAYTITVDGQLKHGVRTKTINDFVAMENIRSTLYIIREPTLSYSLNIWYCIERCNTHLKSAVITHRRCNENVYGYISFTDESTPFTPLCLTVL